MFIWNDGYVLRKAGLALDFTRRMPCGFVSHAHSDHIARHELTLCTPETAALYQHRLGKRPVKPLNFFEPIDWSGLKLTAYPAGHCLGSSMLLAEDAESGESLLFTGDFKLGESATAQKAIFPKADILILESTFGSPVYIMPPRDSVIEELINLVKKSFEDGRTPVFFSYTLGKSQEITKILTEAGFLVQQHRDIYEISQIYDQFGMNLGDVTRLDEDAVPEKGRVLIIPPSKKQKCRLPEKMTTFSVTGWAIDKATKYKYGVDHALPLSDHADFNELLEAVRMTEAKKIYCFHGMPYFVDCLRDMGFNAFTHDPKWTQKLF